MKVLTFAKTFQSVGRKLCILKIPKYIVNKGSGRED